MSNNDFLLDKKANASFDSRLSLLHKYDDNFSLTYLALPPYDTANEVAECIDIAIEKAFKIQAKNKLQGDTDGNI